jgi:hypothetical protein
MNYDGSNNPIAYHEYKVILEDYYGYTDQYGESYIVFNSDGSKFLLDEFFNENDFSDLIDVLDELVEDFEDKFE